MGLRGTEEGYAFKKLEDAQQADPFSSTSRSRSSFSNSRRRRRRRRP